ncbi:glycosyltransferase [Vibrio aestuarianus]|uniref:glycosyltransferase n=1 Tax=Vibrio aestuarianus TaxID=28171 RepID=UPI000B1C59BE|nr:glycosyltransferase [Vibrio aestuarianus]MDE1349458.1 glycosyltransferase [Vibrio aestuarianus]NGZ14817.1 glycosyltransferase [Vibrio aestuarianus]NKZ50965.1 glycosyltransferase [Vibrio aestuarianus]
MNNQQPYRRNVIHVVQHLAPGGLESLTLDLLNFANPQTNTLILSLEGNKEAAIKNWPKLEAFSDRLLFLDKKNGVHLAMIPVLVNLFRFLRVDVVHTHHIGPLIYAGIAAKIAKVQVRIHTEHDVWHLENKKHFNLQKWVLKAVKPILVGDASYVADTLRQRFHYANTITVKNGIDCEKFNLGSKKQARKQLGLDADTTFIGCAGRLETVKGHDLAIKSLALLPDSVHLVIAGQGSQRDKLQALAKRCAVTSRVHFLGLVEDMPIFYQAIDLFCMPSRCEGFPLSPLEAQACGTSAVLTNVGASRETLCPLSGFIVKPNRVLDLAIGLKQALDYPICFNPRTFVLAHSDIRQMVNSYESLATEALA